MEFLVRKSRNLNASCAGILSWWRIHLIDKILSIWGKQFQIYKIAKTNSRNRGHKMGHSTKLGLIQKYVKAFCLC